MEEVHKNNRFLEIDFVGVMNYRNHQQNSNIDRSIIYIFL